MTGSERLESLLVDEVTEGLDPAGTQELLDLLARGGGESMWFEFERAAAAAELAFGVGATEMPARVVARIRDQARGYVEGIDAASRPEPRPLEAPPRRRPRSTAPAWLLAAVLAALAVLGWWQRLQPAGAPSPDAVAKSRLESDPALIDVPLEATEDPAARGASGRLEWSPGLQQGLMLIDGLAANDPGRWQYQLWIFDASRDERFPVDGGVFDVPAGGPASVAVHVPVAVRQPTLFAVTVEAPGGVVVSDRERIVLVGEVS